MKMKDYIGHLVDVPCSDNPIITEDGTIYNHYWSKRPDMVKDKVTGEMRKTTYEHTARIPNWDGLCYTITARFSFKHPLLDRAMSIRENAIIQSFPDDFIFIGARTNAQRQIGNAVPPKMAKAIAETVIDMINNKQEKEES